MKMNVTHFQTTSHILLCWLAACAHAMADTWHHSSKMENYVKCTKLEICGVIWFLAAACLSCKTASVIGHRSVKMMYRSWCSVARPSTPCH